VIGPKTIQAEMRKPAPARGLALPGTGAKVHEHYLRNGLRLVLLERPGDLVVTSLLWYGAGSRHEAPHEAGVAHFLEHMMFKGTKRFGKGLVDATTTSLGGSNNAFTSFDHTAYWFELASDRFEAALELEADRMKGLLLDPAEFISEKAVVLEELSMGRDDPWRRLSQDVSHELFGRHPYGAPIIGHPETLQPMSVEIMRAWYERTYQPCMGTLVLAGDLHPKSTLSMVRKHFGSIESGPAPAPVLCAPLREPEGERRIEKRWDDAASRLVMAYSTVSVGTDQDFDLDLIDTLLTGGRVSRLYKRLVLTDGLATMVGSSSDTRMEGGAFWINAEAVPGVDLAELERVIEEEITRLADEPIPAKEMRRVQRTLRSGDAFEAETVSDLAEWFGGFAVDADWRMLLDWEERRAAVNAKRVRATARQLLTRERRVVGWSLPGKES